jgi:hypothetical protein
MPLPLEAKQLKEVKKPPLPRKTKRQLPQRRLLLLSLPPRLSLLPLLQLLTILILLQRIQLLTLPLPRQ